MQRWRITFVGEYGEWWCTIVEAENQKRAIDKAWEVFDTPSEIVPMELERVEIRKTN